MDHYAVFGNPVSHSRSPFIHSRFAEQTGQSLEYRTIEAPLDRFADSVKSFCQNGGKGANVTVPFKEQAFELCAEVSLRAKKAGAVNTLVVDEDGQLFGDNTDGIGLVRDLQNKQVPLENSRILLLGAGGAARGVILPLLAEKPAQLVLSNRTIEKADALVEIFKSDSLTTTPMAQLGQHQFDVIINATSAGLSGHVPQLPVECLTAQTICYDMVYLKGITPFNQWAQDNGVKTTYDGLGMLVEQAAESFTIWRNAIPDTQAVLAQLRAML